MKCDYSLAKQKKNKILYTIVLPVDSASHLVLWYPLMPKASHKGATARWCK